MDVLTAVLSFVVAIGVLVTVHEFGHYWVARRLGVKVLRFSIGFGRPLLSWRRGQDDIEYVIAAVPLGGYVKMLDEAEGEVPEHERGRAFNRQPLWVRIAVVVAGPAFNFLFAVIAYWAMFVIGVSGMKPVVGEVTPGSPAAISGLRTEQLILRVDERRTHTWQGVIESVIGASLADGELLLTVREPEGRERLLTLDLREVKTDDLAGGRLFESLGVEPMRASIPPLIGEVRADSPAARGGLARGDRVIAANGEPIGEWRALVTAVRASPGQPMTLRVQRGEVTLALEVVPETVHENETRFGKIGAGVADPEDALARYYATERYGPVEALDKAAAKTWGMTAFTLRMLWKMVMFEVSVKNLSGPISIAQYAGLSARVGVARFLDFLAIVSISLGILNLLPIPLLDGGHLMYYLVELVRGRPVSEEAQFVGQRLGIAMLIGLMGLAFYNDLARIFG